MQLISLDLVDTVFEPGAMLAGQIEWNLARSPKRVTVAVGWYTSGRGSEDEGIEWQQEWQTEQHSGIETFRCQLPYEPLSYSGKLIEIIWYVSAETKKGRAHTRTDIVVAPQGQAITLP